MVAETEIKTTKEGVRTKCQLLTIGTQKLQRTKKKVIPTENIKAEVEVVAAAEADAEIVLDIEAEEVTEAVVVRTAAATAKTAEAEGTAEATPGAVAVIEMVAETGAATEVVIETARGGTAVATPERVAAVTEGATEGPIKMADLRTENSDPATIGVDPEEGTAVATPERVAAENEPVMANLNNNNLMVTEKMVSINKLYEKTRKIWKKPEDKQNETKKVLGISRICRTRIFRCWSAILSPTHPAHLAPPLNVTATPI